MPTTSGPREVPESLAGDLGDLYAIRADLETVRRYCERIKLEWEDIPSADWDVAQGLCEAAVARYVRCFAKGRRVRLEKSWLPVELHDLHQAFKKLRDEHLAHSVNDFEQGSVTVHVVESGGAREVQNVGMGVARVSGFAPPGVDELMRLCDALLVLLRERIEHRRVEVEDKVKSLPVDEVYSWRPPGPYNPSGKQRMQRPGR